LSPIYNQLVIFTQDFGNLPAILVSAASNLAATTANDGAYFSTFKKSQTGTKENIYCSGRGVCDTKSGTCTCFVQFGNSNGNGVQGNSEFSRADCGAPIETIIECPGEIPCNGHGVCSSYPSYACTCQEGWSSADCAERTCPKGPKWFGFPGKDNVMHSQFDMEECSAMGTCDRSTGQCGCIPPFTGSACQYLSCPGAVECSGHGVRFFFRQIRYAKNGLFLFCFIYIYRIFYLITSHSVVYRSNKWQRQLTTEENHFTPNTAPCRITHTLGMHNAFMAAFVMNPGSGSNS
jgi:hypothetical protein